MPALKELCTTDFCKELRALVAAHHHLYPSIPPQGIYFESLVERAFLKSGHSRDSVYLENPNSAKADLVVGDTKLSLKTETGGGTKRESISITKLCTTEATDWTSEALIAHALEHLDRYDALLLLRAIRLKGESGTTIDYQLIEIPLEHLKKMKGCTVAPVGKRKGRTSLAVDVTEAGEVLFRVHFDGADGKCQIRNLKRSACVTLDTWQQNVPKE